MNINRFLISRQAARIGRYHTERMFRNQTVGEHTFGVLCLVLELTNGKPSHELFACVLHHDVPEAITGDIPAPARWRSPALQASVDVLEDEIIERYGLYNSNDLSVPERRVLRLADLLELVMFCIEEAEMGNTIALTIADRAWDALWTKHLGVPDGSDKIRSTTMSGEYANSTEKGVIQYVEHRYDSVRRQHGRR